MKRVLENCPAPAKLNLFLHVTGRRPDGYHLLQSAFQLIDHCDLLHFNLRQDGEIRRLTDMPGVPEAADLTVRAARLLQNAAQPTWNGRLLGADIRIDKRLPMGGGLGGGSSDAATTLMALDHLWQTGLSRAELMALGLKLGADVPFFVFGRNAFAEGIGEALTPLETPDCWYVVLEPGVMVATASIFGASELTRDTKPVKITDFSGATMGFGRNDLQVVASSLFPQVAEAIEWLGQFGDARMTGSGACVFCAFGDERLADRVLEESQAAMQTVGRTGHRRWTIWKARALNEHPMAYLQGA